MSETHAAQPAPTPPPAVKAGNGLATAGFVLGLLGLLGSFIPVINIGGIVLGLLGAVLAAVGLAKAKKVGAGKGLAIAGMILGGLALVIGVVVNIAFASSVDDALKETTDTTVEAPADATDDPANDDDEAADDGEAASDDALGTSRSNPAPLGSAITGGDWTVTINSVSTADADSMDQTPEAGSTLLIINMTATYNGTDSQGATAWVSADFVTADGSTVDGLDGSTLFIPEDQFDSLATVYEGASVTGNKMIEVPAENWQDGVLAISPDLLSDKTFVAVK